LLKPAPVQIMSPPYTNASPTASFAGSSGTIRDVQPSHPLKPPPDAIILSGPDFYRPHITHLYGGYKRTKNLYGKATYQKDPDQGGTGEHEAFIYWSAVDMRWCVGQQLGASMKEVSMHEVHSVNPVPIYQVAEDVNSLFPNLFGHGWVANLYGTGATYQADHMLHFEHLKLPSEAADPARAVGGYAHICYRKFVDYEFPPKTTSLEGDPPLLRFGASRFPPINATVWAPASGVADMSGTALFGSSSEPQGDWLDGMPPHRGGPLPIFAAICEYPGQTESLFAMSPHVNSLGTYHVWLYDIWLTKWRRITIDEYIPVVPSEEYGAAWPWGGGNGRLLWALLLEKALAKLCGSYEALHSSEPGALLMSLTGEQKDMRCWVKDGTWFSRWRYLAPDARTVASPSHDSAPDTHRRVHGNMVLRCPVEREPGTWHQVGALFKVLQTLHKENVLLVAYRDPGLDASGERRVCRLDPGGSGIIHGTGYSVLQFVEVPEENLELVQVRNLWGTGMQWRGAWSDDSPEWDAYPEVRRHHKRHEHKGTGRVWMTWTDFCAQFDRIDTCPMPQAARKASYVPRPIPGQRSKAGRPANRGKGGAFGYFFGGGCCAVERSPNSERMSERISAR